MAIHSVMKSVAKVMFSAYTSKGWTEKCLCGLYFSANAGIADAGKS